MILETLSPVLRELDVAARASGVAYLLVGATARTIVCDDRVGADGRATSDVDFGVAIRGWPHFHALRRALLAGRFVGVEGVEHRLRHENGVKLDLIPFGGTEDAEGRIEWPTSGIRMDVTGFSEAHADAEDVVVAAELVVKVASVRGLLVLKAIAYEDRKVRGVTHDLDDMEFVVDHAAILVGETRIHEDAGEAMRSDEVSYLDAGAYCLGRDVSLVFDERVTRALLRVSERLSDPDGEEIRTLHRRDAFDDDSDDRGESASRWRALGLGIRHARHDA